MSDAATTATTTAATTATTGTTTTTAATATAAAPWYGDKIPAETLGLWQNKGIDAKDPVAVATRLTEFYRNAERHIGAPPEEMIRLPRANADTSEIKAFLGKIGVPAEAKDYDLSSVKFTDGSELDQGFTDTIRSVLHNARVPGDRAAEVVKALVKIEETAAATDLAERTAGINAAQQELKNNWGTNYDVNMVAARTALDRLGNAAGLNADQIKAGWDALSTVGGIGAQYAMEMLRVAATQMGESPFVTGTPNVNGGAMSREAAKAEIESLKQDKDWFAKWMRGDRVERQRWDNLHKIAFGRAA